jgi:hypothetical protein
MDEGDEAQAARLRRDLLSEVRKGEAVDNRLRPVGHGGERRPVRSRIPSRKFDDSHDPAACAQALDNVAVEQVSAGELIEPARDDEDEFGHPSGAS